MGTNLICLQVHLNEKKKSNIRGKVLQSIRKQAIDDGFIEFSSQNHTFYEGREVIIGPSEGSWLTVLGSDTHLRTLAKTLSQELDLTVIFVCVIDSSIVHLRRFDGGEMVDEYCNAPHHINLYVIDPVLEAEWIGLSEDDLKEMTRGNLERWQDLFTAETNPAELREIWDSDPVFADDILWATIKALDMNGEEMFYDPGDILDKPEFTQLAFRVDPNSVNESPNPPNLKIGGHNVVSEVFVNQNLNFQFWIINLGKPSRGIEIIVYGTALVKGIVSFSKIVLENLREPGIVNEGTFDLITGIEEGREFRFLEVNFKEFDFPGDIPNDLKAEAGRKAGFTFSIPVSIIEIGEGDLNFSFIPYEDRSYGHVIHHASITSLPSPK